MIYIYHVGKKIDFFTVMKLLNDSKSEDNVSVES